jgi:uncharacterized protein YciI
MRKQHLMKAVLVVIPLLWSLLTSAQDGKYSIVFLNKKTQSVEISQEELKKIMEGHMANMKRLADEGKLLIAGPFEGGGGIFVMNSASSEEIKQWISADPGVQANRWNIEILPFIPRHGGVCPVNENYKMTMYSFVRFDAIVHKFTAGNYPAIMQQHNAYLKEIIATGNVIAEVIFGEHDGGILILRGDVSEDLITADPAVKQGLIEYQMKKLYIAEGSFCE